jgi:hypothetical protein
MVNLNLSYIISPAQRCGDEHGSRFQMGLCMCGLRRPSVVHVRMDPRGRSQGGPVDGSRRVVLFGRNDCFIRETLLGKLCIADGVCAESKPRLESGASLDRDRSRGAA